MTMTHPPAAAAAGQPPQPGDPGQPDRPADPAVRIQITPGGYLLGVLAAAFSALTLPAVAPGRTALAYLAATAALVAALLGSLIAHELGHALVARRYGGSGAVTVGFLGGRRHGRDELPTPRAQWRVAAAGPAVSLLLAGAGVAAAAVMAALGVFAHRSGALPFAVVATVTWINGLLTLANLIPGAGLDGGRIVRALAWARSGDPARASLIAARVGQVTGAVLTAAGVTAVLTGHLPGLWIVLLGLLMVGASRSEAGRRSPRPRSAGWWSATFCRRPGPRCRRCAAGRPCRPSSTRRASSRAARCPARRPRPPTRSATSMAALAW